MVLKNIEPKLIENKNNQAVTTSLKVAETFGKKHFNVVRDIENLVSGGVFKNEDTQMFMKSQYKNHQNNQTYRMYYMNKDGFTLLAMGFTGKKAMEFKMEYINAFNAMQAKLKEQPTRHLTATSQLRLATKSIIEIDDRVSKLESNQTINPGEYSYLNSLVSKQVYSYANNVLIHYNRKQIKELYKDISNGIKQVSNIKTRSQLRAGQYNSVIDYVTSWVPSTATKQVVKSIQLDLDDKETM